MMMTKVKVRVPAVPDIGFAIRLYYGNIEIRSKDIRALFGGIGGSRVTQLKKLAKARMDERGIPNFDASAVHTATAYESWGLNIKDLEYRYAKLKKYREEA